MSFLKSIIDGNAREVKKYARRIGQINDLEPGMKKLSDDELQGKTAEFRERLDNGSALKDILPEAFAVVREAAWRTLGQRHYDVQLIGGMVLNDGRIAEMKTGEGKTLVATLPSYLNALTSEGVHVVTVNDYLARRDSEWMGQVYAALGLSVGLIVHGLDHGERKESYAADITYGTNNEFGFDYLRDNMASDPGHLVQRPLHYAIVDEVDSILIDEARTPLIISGQADKPTDLYARVAKIMPRLKEEIDYTVNEKDRVVVLTEKGVGHVEKRMGLDNLYDDLHNEVAHHVNQALRAHVLYRKDRDYVIKDGEVIIVDEFTGRLMFGRRYSEGLHQAIEAKENVKIERESQTLATITFQNFFRMYKKLSGMTGTAMTEEQEFINIYKLDVVDIPTNKPLARDDMPDAVFRTETGKFRAVVDAIKERHADEQPVLVGTISIEKSEYLSRKLKKAGIPHQVLNAKFHEKEAEIVSQAGQPGMVTIATNMAGRGTDIVLGSGIQDVGGLHIIGTERHESRRIDNQLRGRAGRQGDPGSTQFYISMEDDLMRLFGENLGNIMDRIGMEEGMSIESKMLSRSIESAQKRVENRNYEIRKNVLNYDDVMNKQREVIYAQRLEVLHQDNLKDHILGMIETIIEDAVERNVAESPHPEDWDLESFLVFADKIFLPGHKLKPKHLKDLNKDEIVDFLLDQATELYDEREKAFGDELMRTIERAVMLQIVDSHWKDHLDAMDMLRDGIGLRAYGQRDPLVEYRNEAYDMFTDMSASIQQEVVTYMMRVTPRIAESEPEKPKNVTENLYDEGGAVKKPRRNAEHIGRNDPCPCGSGKKYKKCCGSPS